MTLEAAKKAAMNSIGLSMADWFSIGPSVEVPDRPGGGTGGITIR
jgi:hypothetical protein